MMMMMMKMKPDEEVDTGSDIKQEEQHRDQTWHLAAAHPDPRLH